LIGAAARVWIAADSAGVAEWAQGLVELSD
jgi:hypothetical protein